MAKRKESITIQEIAETLKVSASTVSRALNNNPRISRETKETVWKIANQMGYQPFFPNFVKINALTKAIGFVVPNISNPFYIETYHTLQEEAQQKGYQVILFNTGNSIEVEKQAIETSKNLGLSGLIISLTDPLSDSSHISNLNLGTFPVVNINRVNFDLPVPKVIIDNFQGSFLATNHLLTVGCKHISLIIGKKNCPIYSEVIKGYRQALSKNGFAFKPEYIVSSNLTESDVDASLDILFHLEDVPDGIITSNPAVAVQTISRLKEFNFRVPEDISIVTFGNHSLIKYWTPSISCITTDASEFAKTITNKFFEILQRTSNGQQIPVDTQIITTRLTIRGSSIKR